MVLRADYRVGKTFQKVTQINLGRWALAKKCNEDPDYAVKLYESFAPQNAFSFMLDSLRGEFYTLPNTAGILSLSEIPDNLLMWAHYTEGHTGFVLVLDGCNDFFKKDGALLWHANPEPVDYRLKRPRMKIEETSKESKLRNIFFVKSLDWKYEKAWRYLKFLKDADKRLGNDVYLFRLSPKCIMGVILGCCRTEELQNKILDLQRDDLHLGRLQIQQAHLSQTHYRLNIGEIET